MIWIIWKRIVCAGIVAAALIGCCPAKMLSLIEGRRVTCRLVSENGKPVDEESEPAMKGRRDSFHIGPATLSTLVEDIAADLTASQKELQGSSMVEKVVQDGFTARVVERTYRNDPENGLTTYRFTAERMPLLAYLKQLEPQGPSTESPPVNGAVVGGWIWLILVLATTAPLLPLSFVLPDLAMVREMGSLIWVAWALLGMIAAALTWRNARQRYASGGPGLLWALAAFAAPIVTLPVYAQFRPNGDLWHCGQCSRTGLLSLARCPHCGTAGAARTGLTKITSQP